MHIDIVAVGKLKESFWREACAEYGKRLTRYVGLKVTEVDDRDPAKHGGDAKARRAEAADIMKNLPKGVPGQGGRLVCLDSGGTQMTSEEFSKFIEELELGGCKDLVFIIGGPTGIDDDLKKKADDLVSFGKITLPHNLARVVLLEQIYRAYRIMRGEPYHK